MGSPASGGSLQRRRDLRGSIVSTPDSFKRDVFGKINR